MKFVEHTNATDSLADYVANIGKGPVIVMSHGQPIAALVPIENADLESITLSTHPDFIELISQSRQRARQEGTVSQEEMRRPYSGSS